MIEIHLHGALRNLIEESLQPLRLDINSPGEAYFALRSQLPGFAQAIREGAWRWLIDDAQEVTQDDVGLLLRPGASLHIYPVAEGDGFIIDFFRGVFNFLGSLFFPSLSGYDTDAVDERASYLFNGPVNTVEQGGCVPLVYGGPLDVGSYTLSVGVSSARLTPPRTHLPDSVKGKAAEFENTLQTGATIRIVDLISEGEIEGLVDGAQSVFLDGVPVQNSAGEEVVAVGTPHAEAADYYLGGWPVSYQAPASGAPAKNQNYKGVKVDSRNGTADQTPLDGIPAIETERNVNLKVTTATPRTQAVQAANTDVARVTIRFPRLVEVTKKADRIATKVRFAIDVQANGEADYTTKLNQTIHDKNNSPAEISYDIPLEGNAPWNIRVRRLTPDSQQDTVHNEIWWARLTEIQEIRQSYPHSAVVGIVAEAERFDGDISKRKYRVKGKKVLVPGNYDPEARTYAGAVWDGTFKTAWTNNGAWVVYDLLINRRFGLGQHIDPAYLSAIKWGLYEIAQFNDVDVHYDALTGPAGYGQEALRFSQPVSEPRFTFNGVLQKQGDAKKVIDNVLSNFHAAAYYGSGAVVPVQDSPAEQEFLLTNANVKEGDIHYSDLAHRDRVSVVNVSFNNPDNAYKLEPEPVVDDALVEKYGHRVKNLVSMFNTSRAQAHRFGRLYLFEQEHESDTGVAVVGMDVATSRPGAVGKIADRYTAGVRAGCRLVSYDADGPSIILDDMTDLQAAVAGAWAANVVLADGSVATASIDRFLPAENKIVLDEALPSAPLPGAVTALEKTGVSARLVRLVGMKETDDPLGYEVAVKAYHAGKYPAVEADLNVVVPSYRISDAERYVPVDAPDTVTLVDGEIEDAGARRPTLTISVEGGPSDALVDFGLRGPFAAGAEDEADWVTIERSSLRTLPVPGLLLAGTYRARARTVNSTLTARSAWVESDTASIDGAVGPDVPPAPRPPTVINLVYDTLVALADTPDAAGEYKITSTDGEDAKTTAEAAATGDGVIMTLSEIDADDYNHSRLYFRDIDPGDMLVLYRDDWFIAWRITTWNGPTSGAWRAALALITTYGAPDTPLDGLSVRIGSDRTPSTFTIAVRDDTVALDTAAARNVAVYPGDTYLQLFWNNNSGARNLDSDIYWIGARIRYRAVGGEDWIEHTSGERTGLPPEIIANLTNDTTYEVELSLAYRLPPSFATVFGEASTVTGTPKAAGDEVLAEYEITAGFWASDDGSRQFTGYFTAGQDVYLGVNPTSSRGSVRVVRTHPDPDFAPVGALTFEHIDRSPNASRTYFNLVMGGGSEDSVSALNDNRAFASLEIRGFENERFLRSSAGYGRHSWSYGRGGGVATAWNWRVDAVLFNPNAKYLVRLLRVPAPEIGQVPLAFIRPPSGTNPRASGYRPPTLYWANPINAIEAGLLHYRLRYRTSLDGAWTVLDEDFSLAAGGINQYAISAITAADFEIGITPVSFQGMGPETLVADTDRRDVLAAEYFGGAGFERRALRMRLYDSDRTTLLSTLNNVRYFGSYQIRSLPSTGNPGIQYLDYGIAISGSQYVLLSSRRYTLPTSTEWSRSNLETFFGIDDTSSPRPSPPATSARPAFVIGVIVVNWEEGYGPTAHSRTWSFTPADLAWQAVRWGDWYRISDALADRLLTYQRGDLFGLSNAGMRSGWAVNLPGYDALLLSIASRAGTGAGVSRVTDVTLLII